MVEFLLLYEIPKLGEYFCDSLASFISKFILEISDIFKSALFLLKELKLFISFIRFIFVFFNLEIFSFILFIKESFIDSFLLIIIM